MISKRDPVKRLHSEHDPVAPPLDGRPRHTHSYAPPGSGLQMDAREYVIWRRFHYPFHPPQDRKRHDVEPDHQVASIHSLNFWGPVVTLGRARVDRANDALVVQFILFALCYVELAAEQIASHLEVPLATPDEIFTGLMVIGEVQSPVLGHDIWRYAKCVEHPVVGAAVFNAVYNSWGAPRHHRAQPYPPPEDPFVLSRPPDEAPRVVIPLPLPEDAPRHQHRTYPPGDEWPRLRWGPRRKPDAVPAPAPAGQALPSEGGFPTVNGECPRDAAFSRQPASGAMPPTSDRALPAVDPGRFADAALAAFGVGATCHHYRHKLLLAFAQRLFKPTSSGLPDPFAPAMAVLIRALYAPSRLYWDESVRAFRSHYLRDGTGDGANSLAGESNAAILRWQAMLTWAEESPTPSHVWSRAKTAHGVLKRAAALVAAAARMPVWPVRTQVHAGAGCFSDAITRCFGSEYARATWSAEGFDAAAAKSFWRGLQDRRRFVSRKALGALTQRFLSFLIASVGSEGAPPLQTYRVCAEELAEWAFLDPTEVRAAFTSTDPQHSPAHELHSRVLLLPDWRWSDPAKCPQLKVPWLSAPPRAGQSGGCLWQEVTLHPELLPCLRRLCLLRQQVPEALAAREC